MALESMLAWYETLPIWLMSLLAVWTLVWKGLALWKSSKLNRPVWFVILLVINTFGILEILYLFLFSKLSQKIETKEKPAKKKR